MKDLEKQLNNLPKAKLAKKAQIKILLIIFNSLKKDFLGFRLFLKPAFAFVLLFALLLPATYAYGSENVGQGHILFPIKKSIENIELAFTFDKGKKIEKKDDFLSKRIEETQIMINISKEREEEIIESIESAFKVRQEIEEEKNKINNQNLTEKIENSDIKRIETLNRIAEDVGLDGAGKIIDYVSVSLELMSGPKGFVKEEIIKSIIPATGEQVKSNGNAYGVEKQEVKNSIEQIKKDFSEFEDELKEKQYEQKEIEKARGRVKEKINNAENAVDNGQVEESRKIIEISRAFMNHANKFMSSPGNSDSKKSNSSADNNDKPNNRGNKK